MSNVNRKKILNKEKFVFKEDEFVPPIRGRSIATRTSAQKRLENKAESNRPSYNIPEKDNKHNQYFSPYTSSLDRAVGKVPEWNRTSRGGVVDRGGRASHRRGAGELGRAFESMQIATNRKVGSERKVKVTSINTDETEQFDPFSSYHSDSNSINNNPSNCSSNNNHYVSNTVIWKPPVMFKSDDIGVTSTLTQSSNRSQDKWKRVLAAKEPEKEICICYRPRRMILCGCGYTFTGRIQKDCKVHPKSLHLMDVNTCPQCKIGNVFTLKEYHLPDGSD